MPPATNATLPASDFVMGEPDGLGALVAGHVVAAGRAEVDLPGTRDLLVLVLEHHYFPRVPFYNLRKAHMKLRPLYAQLGLKAHTYRDIVWQWFVLNRAPHTNWEIPAAPPGPGAPGGGSSRDDAIDDSTRSSERVSVDAPAAQVAARIAIR